MNQSYSYKQILARKSSKKLMRSSAKNILHQNEAPSTSPPSNSHLSFQSRILNTGTSRRLNNDQMQSASFSDLYGATRSQVTLSKSPASVAYLNKSYMEDLTSPIDQNYEEEKRKIESRKMKLIKEREQMEALKQRRHIQRPKVTDSNTSYDQVKYYSSKKKSPKRPMLSTMLDPPENTDSPHFPKDKEFKEEIGSETDQDLQLQEDFYDRIYSRHPNAAVLMRNAGNRNWLRDISFDDLKYLLKISEGDLRETTISLMQEKKLKEEAEAAVKRAKHALDREKVQNKKLEEQNDMLREMLEAKDQNLSKCLSDILRLKDAFIHCQQVFKIIAQQTKKLLRKQEIMRGEKVIELSNKAVQNIDILKNRLWNQQEYQFEEVPQEDWGMIEDFLNNNGDLATSQIDVRELTGNSEEIMITSLGREARNQMENLRATKGLDQSPSMTGPFKQQPEENLIDENLNDSEIVKEETPKNPKIIQTSGFSASHSFAPPPHSTSGHFGSPSQELEMLEKEQSNILFSSSMNISRNGGNLALDQNSSIQQVAGESAYFPTSPNAGVNEFILEHDDEKLHNMSLDDAPVVSISGPLHNRMEIKLNQEISAALKLSEKQKEVQALMRENSLTKETVTLTMELERERLKKQYTKELERLKKNNTELKRKIKELQKEYEKQLKALIGQIKEKNESISKLEKEAVQLRKDKKDLRNTLKRVENDYSVLQTQTSDVRHEFHVKDEAINQGRIEVEEMNSENERLREKLREARQEFAKLSSQMLSFGSEKDLRTPNILAELLELRKRIEAEEANKVNVSLNHDQELHAAQKESKQAQLEIRSLRERIILLMQERSKLDNEVSHYKKREAEAQEEFHIKEVKLHDAEIQLEVRKKQNQDEKKSSITLEKQLLRRIEMLKEVQNTNEQITQTLRALKRQNQEVMKSQAKAENQLYTAEREKSQLALTLQKMQEQLQQIQHQRDHLAALLESERKDHKETGPLSTAVQQLSLIILNKSRRPGDMKPEERALVKEIFDQNIQSLLKECEDKLRRSQANQRILSQTLKTHVSNSTNYLSDISNLASQVQKLGKTLQKFGASDLPVEIAMLRDEIVQQRAEMRSKAAFADQEMKELEIEFKHLNAGLLQDQLGQAMFEGSDSIKSAEELQDPDGLSLRIKELISKNEGETALLSQNKRLATDVDQLQKQVERLNSEQMSLMERNVSLINKEADTMKLKHQVEQHKMEKSDIEKEKNSLRDQLEHALSSNSDLKLLIAKMEQERIKEKRLSPLPTELQKTQSSPDRAVGFFPANQGDPSPFRRETFGFDASGPIDLSSVAGKDKQLDLSKQLNEASIVQLNLNLSQGQSVGVNESDNELLQLLHCQCSAMEEILLRRKMNTSSSPVVSKHSES